MDKRTGIKIIQANLGRSKLATNEIVERAHEIKAPILLLQEPYAYNNQIAALGKYTNTIITANDPDQERPWACIAILNKEYTAVLLKDVSTSHCVCAHITGPTGSFYAISLYCQFSMDTEIFVEQLDGALQVVGNRPVIIGMDANAVSPMWSWRTTLTPDNSAQELENLILRRLLIPANSPNQPCTYIRGNRDIDVTLTDPRTASNISGWKVKEDWVSSDHRPIVIEFQGKEVLPKIREKRYNTARADWKAFRDNIRREVENCRKRSIHTVQEAEELAIWIRKAMHRAARGTIPKKRQFQKSVPWWNSELTDLKKTSNELRRQYQQEQNPDARKAKRADYRRARVRYSKAIQETRHNSLVSFVEDTSKKNPYGMIYKIASDKQNVNKALASIKTNTGSTTDWSETANALLDGFFGNPAEETSVVQEEEVYIPGPRHQSAPSIPDWTRHEVEQAIKATKNGKAPGVDMIEAEMIKQAAKAGMIDLLVTLYNGCRHLGHFPDDWKTGAIRVLLKAEDKDPTDPKSYRPICLLSILSKILERLLRNSLAGVIQHQQHASDRQYGYRAGRSTEDAIAEVRRIVESTNKSMTLGLLFDVTGAFDHLRWSSITRELQKRGTSTDLLALVSSYLRDRKVTIIDNYQKATKTIHRGCPQGSILGPDFWNICLDALLNNLTNQEADVVAYADDLIVLVHGNSRHELETNGQKYANIIIQWTKAQGLTLSKTKTEMILLKDLSRGLAGKAVTNAVPSKRKKRTQLQGNMTGSLVKTGKGGKRPPCIKIEGKGIRYADHVKYLGVTIGTRLTIAQHIVNVGTKGKRLFQRLGAVIRANWGLRYGCLRILHEGVFLPIVLYAAGAWGDLMTITQAQSLQGHQRTALLKMARAYRTVSTEALQVITGRIPVDLLVKERRSLYEALHIGVRDEQPEAPRTTQHEKLAVKAALREQTMAEWNRRWTETTNGRQTYSFFQDVRERANMAWIEPDHYSTQILTGHGNFGHYLRRFNIQDDDRCACGSEDTAKHLLLDCPEYDAVRAQLVQKLADMGIRWPPEELSCLVNHPETYRAYKEFCKTALCQKRERELLLRELPPEQG